MSYTYEYPRPAVTVDVVVLRLRERKVEVLLIKRKRAPFARSWALPGGFLDMDEELEAAARRELEEETGVRVGPLISFGVYGAVGRDPRGRTVSVAFAGFADPGQDAVAGDDAAAARWHPVERPPKSLAFDHANVLADGLRRMVSVPSEDEFMATLPPSWTVAEARTARASLQRAAAPSAPPEKKAARRKRKTP